MTSIFSSRGIDSAEEVPEQGIGIDKCEYVNAPAFVYGIFRGDFTEHSPSELTRMTQEYAHMDGKSGCRDCKQSIRNALGPLVRTTPQFNEVFLRNMSYLEGRVRAGKI